MRLVVLLLALVIQITGIVLMCMYWREDPWMFAFGAILLFAGGYKPERA